MKILGIETSCDETAAAIIRFDGPAKGAVLSDIIHSQLEKHSPYGGVVPEIAAREHVAAIDHVIHQAIEESGCELHEIDAIAATIGPGLIGGLLVGANAAKALSVALKKPFYGINHLEGHALSTRLSHGVDQPHLLLLVSGGHTQLLLIEDIRKYELLGSTIDDAAGEAFDKVAKLLSLGYPGGPIIEKIAKNGDEYRFDFPRPLKGRAELNFSFSGLKTSVRQNALNIQPITEKDKADIAASFQLAMAESICDRIKGGFEYFLNHFPSIPPKLIIAGGVAANQYLRHAFENICLHYQAELICPPLRLCTDNAVMIAWAAAENIHKGQQADLSVHVRPRWPLNEMS